MKLSTPSRTKPSIASASARTGPGSSAAIVVPQQCLGPAGVACIEVVSGQTDSALRGITAEFQREFEQLRGGGGRTTESGHLGGLVKGIKGVRITGRGGQCQVPRFQLGFRHHFGQTAMHVSALRGRGAGVDAPRQQRMSEGSR